MATHQRSDPRRRQELELFSRLQAGDMSARTALTERFLPLANKLARTIRSGEDPEDLEQVAALGLVKAIDRFDPARSFAFSTFATPTILGELKRYLRDRGWSVRVPRSLQELALRIEHGSGALTSELGRSPTVAELAAWCSCSNEQVLEGLATLNARRAVSMDLPLDGGEESDETRRELPTEERGYRDVENAGELDALMAVLPERDRLILHLRFGEDRLQSEIAAVVGISQMHVSRLIRDSLARLQRAATEGHDARGHVRSA